MIKKMIDYYFRRNVYYIDNVSIYDVKNRVCFNFEYNVYINDYFFSAWFFGYATKQITKKEYDKLHKNKFCNCKIGSGKSTIEYGSPLDIIDEFNRYNKNNSIIIEKDIISCITYIFKHKNYDKSLNNYELNFYKKACLKCNTCLTDYESLFREFDKIIAYFENYEKVNQICGGV